MRYLVWTVATLAVAVTAAWAWYASGGDLVSALRSFDATSAVAFGPLIWVLGAIALRRHFRNRTFLAACAFLHLSAAFATFGVMRDGWLLGQAKTVTLGMPSGEVQAGLGKPSRDGPCGAEQLVFPREPGCKRELVYNSTFAPLNPSYLVIQLDERDQVTSVDWIHSP